MALVIGHFRSFTFHTSRPKPGANSRRRKKSLCVTISKEPPVVYKIEQDNLEQTFECIFDPLVRHDNETDHPDLLFPDKSRYALKPWQLPPYSDDSHNSISNVLKRLNPWSPNKIRRNHHSAAPGHSHA